MLPLRRGASCESGCGLDECRILRQAEVRLDQAPVGGQPLAGIAAGQFVGIGLGMCEERAGTWVGRAWRGQCAPRWFLSDVLRGFVVYL